MIGTLQFNTVISIELSALYKDVTYAWIYTVYRSKCNFVRVHSV